MSRTIRAEGSANSTSRTHSSRASRRRPYRYRRSPTPFYPPRAILPEPPSTQRRLGPHPPRSRLFTPPIPHRSHHSASQPLPTDGSQTRELTVEMPIHATGPTEPALTSVDIRNNFIAYHRTLEKLSPLSLTVEAYRERIIYNLVQIYCLISDIESLIDIIEEDMDNSQSLPVRS
ncbi:hypothetical protein AOQ84DRAFT_45881 [Glonium stellatum]|uniref:Uncharacterized protein n=1 Tax=Glonium stellatum TaxID=574774 RepID=A0A8E2F0G1_9PEZI|nr:hypothetical protein AOQ84DRAFT_45881 [Glonium stellatum]